MSTAYSTASVYIPPSAGVKAGTLQAWRPNVNLLQNIDVSRPATTNVASYVDNTGTRVFVGANVARWDWSEGLSCPSLLVEPQRTNLFDQDLEGAGIVTKTVTVVSGTEYSVSVEGSGSMTLSGAGTGTVTEGSHVTFTASTTSLTLTYTAPLTYVQVEAGAYPTSIIYTSGSTATRNADVISKTGIASLIGQSEGTFYIEVEFFQVGIISFNPGGGNLEPRVQLTYSNNKIDTLVTGNGVDGKVSLIEKNINTTYKIAISYQQNSLKTYISDDTNGEDLSVDTFTNQLDVFSLSAGNGGAPFYGRISALAWWKTAFTDTELQNLTTP